MLFVIFNITILILFVIVIYILYQGAIFVPSKQKTIKTMLLFSKIKPGERMADLGSGDGRILIEFAKKGAIAEGYEINPVLVFIARMKIRRLGLEKKARVFWKSFWREDLSQYKVITVFGIDYIMKRMEKKLYKELSRGSRIIVNLFPFPNKKYKLKKDGVYLYEE